MDPNLNDQNLPPKPTSSVGNVVPPVNPQVQVPAQEPVVPLSNQPESVLPQAPALPLSVPPVQPITPPVFTQQAGPDPKVTNDKPGNDSEEFYPKGPKINRKVALGVFILLMIITIPATVFVARQPQSTQSDAANELTPETVVAIINGQNVLEKDLEQVASEQYDTEAIDREALKDALDTVIERKILEIEKEKLGLDPQDAEINAKVADGFEPTQAYYEVLKDKVTASQTKNWDVYTIAYWLPMTGERQSLTNQETKDVQKQQQDGLKAIDEAMTGLQTSKTALQIARDIANKYPSLKDILGVNGYLLRDIEQGANLSDVENPRKYTFESANKGQAFFDTLYSLKNAGEVKKYVSDKNSGGGVVELVSANTSASFDTYEAWLRSKKTPSLVTVVFSL